MPVTRPRSATTCSSHARARLAASALLSGLLLGGCAGPGHENAAENRAEPPAAGDASCPGRPEGQTAYRQAVAVTGFGMPPGPGAADLWGVDELFAARVARSLEDSGRVRLQATGEPPLAGAGQAGTAAVREAGQRLSAQVLVSGRFLDLSVAGPLMDLPWFDSRRLQAGYRRNLAVEIEVHDAVTGSLLARHRHRELIDGRHRQTGARLGPGFWESAYGTRMARAADSLAELALDALECLPLAAPVQRVDGGRIVIEAGAGAGLQQGDELRVLSSHELRPADRDAPLVERRSLGRARVSAVEPDHAILELEPVAIGVVRAGDLVRAW